MRPTFQLISIFVLALLLFVGYSEAPDYVADALHLKQIGQDITTADTDTMHVEDAASDTITEPRDTARQRVLIFGDSMSQLLALRLCDYTGANGHSLTCVTWNGSGTHQWAASDTLRFYMQRVRPTHVFVCLGSNELYTADMKDAESVPRGYSPRLATCRQHGSVRQTGWRTRASTICCRASWANDVSL